MSIDHLLKTNNNALLSVYDKTGIAEFAKGLHELGWNIISSGGTAKVVAEAGVPWAASHSQSRAATGAGSARSTVHCSHMGFASAGLALRDRHSKR